MFAKVQINSEEREGKRRDDASPGSDRRVSEAIPKDQ